MIDGRSFGPVSGSTWSPVSALAIGRSLMCAENSAPLGIHLKDYVVSERSQRKRILCSGLV
jgi:hypothetical protein